MSQSFDLSGLDTAHVCFVLPKFAIEEIGGAELQIYYLSKELIERGIKVSYIRERSAFRHNSAQCEGIALYAIPRIKYYFLQWINLLPLLWAMHKTRATVYYCRVSKSYLPIVVLGSWLFNAKTAWACSHDREVSGFIPRGKGLVKKILEQFEQILFSKALPKADFLFVQTTKQKELLSDTFKLTGLVLENSHPLPTMAEFIRPLNIVWIANFRDFKRPEKFVELARRMENRPYKFIMVGEIFSAKEKLKFQNDTAQLRNFEYRGSQTLEQVEEVLLNSRLFVNTSDQEGFPNTFIQCLMRGVPIISMNVDPEEVIKDNELGFISSNLQLMDNAIDLLMKDDGAWLETSRRCRKFAESRFSIERYTDSFISICRLQGLRA
jgi:glycosyltransferase involved in cell wall biosynthesis